MAYSVVHFEGFEYHRDQHCLLRSGRRVKIGSRASAILEALIDRAGDYVSGAELMRAAWPDTFVDERNLRVQMTALRKVLNCTRSHVVIHNAPGRGYALVAAVRRSGVSSSWPLDDGFLSSEGGLRQPGTVRLGIAALVVIEIRLSLGDCVPSQRGAEPRDA